jgi:hypothetical protein
MTTLATAADEGSKYCLPCPCEPPGRGANHCSIALWLRSPFDDCGVRESAVRPSSGETLLPLAISIYGLKGGYTPLLGTSRHFAFQKMSSADSTKPTFPPAIPGHTIYRGLCKTKSASMFRSESDRYLQLQMHKDTRHPQVLEWKCSQEPLQSEPPFSVLQLTPGTTQVVRVVRAKCVRLVCYCNQIIHPGHHPLGLKRSENSGERSCDRQRPVREAISFRR